MKGINNIRVAVKQHNEENKDNKFRHVWSVNLWEKNGMRRAYINRTNGRNNKTVGWVDLNTLKLHDFSDWELEEKVKNELT